MTIHKHSNITGYGYDPLDRVVVVTAESEGRIQRFYSRDQLITEIHANRQVCAFTYPGGPLAQREHQDRATRTTLLSTDLQRSVLHTLLAPAQHEPIAYTPYGHSTHQVSFSGFNGEKPEPMTGHYLLGKGYRGYNPTLMRFNSPDNLSPFGKGGANPYAYCAGDPINRMDPTGHFWLSNLFHKLVNWGSLAMVGAGGALFHRSVSSPVTDIVGNTLVGRIDVSGLVISAAMGITGVAFNQVSQRLAVTKLAPLLPKHVKPKKPAALLGDSAMSIRGADNT